MTDTPDAFAGDAETAAPARPLEATVIDRPPSTSLVVVRYGDFELPIEATTDPQAIQGRILARLFQSETPDQAFGTWESQSSDALVGQRFDIRGVRWGIYQSDDGPVALAEVDAINLETGESDPFITTAPNLTGFIRLFELKSWMPFRAQIRESKTARGFNALHFERVI